jgi:hypothetical protein
MLPDIGEVALCLNLLVLCAVPLYVSVALHFHRSESIPEPKLYTDILAHLEKEVGEWNIRVLLERESSNMLDIAEAHNEEDEENEEEDGEEEEEDEIEKVEEEKSYFCLSTTAK